MSTLKIQRVNALPGILEPSCLYIVTNIHASFADLYFTSSDGSVTRRVVTRDDVLSMTGGSVGDDLITHMIDSDVHLTPTQNTWIDAITVSSAEVNQLVGVTSAIQTQLSNKQPLDADLTAIAALLGTTGLLKKTAANTWVLDTTAYAIDSSVVHTTGNESIAGTKTFNSNVICNNILTLTGNSAIEIGHVDGTTSTPFIDFHSGATLVDYDVRIMANNGTGVTGNGDLHLYAGNVFIYGILNAQNGIIVPTGKKATLTDAPVASTDAANKGYVDSYAVPLSHATDTALHLTSTQNTWIDTITASAAEVNYLVGVTSAVQTQLNDKLNTSSYTASDILAKLLTVDGAGSGLDADTVDGFNSSSISRNIAGTAVGNASDTNYWALLASFNTGVNEYVDGQYLLAVTNSSTSTSTSVLVSVYIKTTATLGNPQVSISILGIGGASAYIGDDSFKIVSGGWASAIELWVQKKGPYGKLTVTLLSSTAASGVTATWSTAAGWQITEPVGTVNNVFSTGLTYRNNKVWHAGNDGAGSGLDADTLDGYNVGTSGSTIPLLNNINTWSAANSFNGGVILNNADDQLRVARSATQYLVIENNDISSSPYITSYTDPTNAKAISYDSRTNVAGDNVIGGALGHSFNVNGSPSLTVNANKSVSVLFGLQVSGTINSTGDLEIGRIDGVASTPYIDFHSGATAVSYDARIIASGGNGTIGGGNLQLYAAYTYLIGHVSMLDNKNLYIGTGNDFSIKHDGTNTSILNTTGNLYISNTAVGTGVSISSAGSNFELWGAAAYLDATTTYIRSQDGTVNFSSINSNGLQLNVPIKTASGVQIALTDVASAVNYLEIKHDVTGGSPTIGAVGSDVNVGLNITTKGTGSHKFYTNGTSNLQFSIDNTSAAVNYLKVTGGVTGGRPRLEAVGANTDIGLDIITKGSSNITLQATNTNVTGILNVAGKLIVNGNTTTITSTTVVINDIVLTLGGSTPPVVDNNKDRGIEFRWHNGTSAKLGFFGFDDSTGNFTFIPDATDTNEVYSGTKGTIDAYLDWANISSKPTGSLMAVSEW